MDLENITQSKVSQSEKSKSHMISLIWDIKLKLMDTDNSRVATRQKGVGSVKGKGVKHIVTEDGLTVGGEHTI